MYLDTTAAPSMLFHLLKIQAGGKARNGIHGNFPTIKNKHFPQYQGRIFCFSSRSFKHRPFILQRPAPVCTRLRIEKVQDEWRGWRSPPSMSKPMSANHITICSVAKNSSRFLVVLSLEARRVPGPFSLHTHRSNQSCLLPDVSIPAATDDRATDRGGPAKMGGGRGGKGFSSISQKCRPPSSFVRYLNACFQVARSSIHFYGAVLSASQLCPSVSPGHARLIRTSWKVSVVISAQCCIMLRR